MCSPITAEQYFTSIAEDFAKPDWETSPRSTTYKLRELINRVIVNVQKFELRIHHRCRVKKPDAPIHHDPFWFYNGYDDALDSLVWNMCSEGRKQAEHRDRNQYPHMLSCYKLHYELLWTLNLWRSFCQAIKDAPAAEERTAPARAFAAEIKALNQEVATWEYPPSPN
ncbi:hypothetical protein B0J17DRAFT_708989 [Rhizoctonia solani]|nr:hypothetical protein B0J17DRAFT_708989 [Rhizoctonia solani]